MRSDLHAVCRRCGGTEFTYEQQETGTVSFTARADGSGSAVDRRSCLWNDGPEYTCSSCGNWFSDPALGTVVRTNPWAGWDVDCAVPEIGTVSIGEIVVACDGFRGEVAAIEDGGEVIVLAGWHERFRLVEVRRYIKSTRQRVLAEVAQ